MQILVTGAAGFIGFHLSQKLLQNHHTVIAIDNLNHAYNPQFKNERLKILKKNRRFNFYESDILHPRSLIRIFNRHKITTIYHLAARTGVRTSIKYPKLYSKTNVEGTKNIYQLASRFGVKQFLFASSSSVYGDSPVPFTETVKLPRPTSPYAASKQEAERLLFKLHRQFKLPTTVFRFFSVYGPHGRPDMAPYLFSEAILTNKPLTVYGDGKHARDYTFIADIVAALIKAREHDYPFQIINLGNHTPVTVAALITIIESLTGKKATVRYAQRRPEEIKTTWANISRAKKLLNWQPQTSLAQGMQQFISWYQKNRIFNV